MTDAPDNVASDWMISVDDHVLEPPDVWQTGCRPGTGSGPEAGHDGDGRVLGVRGQQVPTSGLSAVAGKREDEFSPEPITYADMRPGCYDPVARLADMDRPASWPRCASRRSPGSAGRSSTRRKDKELALLCVRAYNDWMIDEWCGIAPGRYIPLIAHPAVGPGLAAAEIERCAAKGARALAFSENPAPLGLPDDPRPGRYWDPVMAAAAGRRAWSSACTSARRRTDPDDLAGRPGAGQHGLGDRIRTSGAMLDVAVQRRSSSGCPTSRSPCPRAASAGFRTSSSGPSRSSTSSGTGRRRRRAMAAATRPERRRVSGVRRTRARPAHLDIRQIFRDHIFGCFIDDDRRRLRSIDMIGVDNIMIETDYPHSDSTWPELHQDRQEAGRRPARRPAVQDPPRQRRAALPFHPGRATLPRGPVR